MTEKIFESCLSDAKYTLNLHACVAVKLRFVLRGEAWKMLTYMRTFQPGTPITIDGVFVCILVSKLDMGNVRLENALSQAYDYGVQQIISM